MLPFKKNGKIAKRLASHVSWQQEAFQSDDVGASSIRFRLNNSHRYTPIISSYFHFLESIDISNVYVVFSFHDQLWKELFTLQITDYTTDLFHDEIYYMDVLPTPLAMLFVIFSSANQPQKIYHYPTRGYPTTRLLSSLPDPTRSWKSLPVRAWWQHR